MDTGQVLFMLVYELRWRQACNYAENEEGETMFTRLNKLGYGKTLFSFWDRADDPSDVLLARVTNHNAGFGLSYLLTEPLYYVNDLHFFKQFTLYQQILIILFHIRLL